MKKNFNSIVEIQQYCKKHHKSFRDCNCPFHPLEGNWCPIGTPKYCSVEYVGDYIVEFFCNQSQYPDFVKGGKRR